MSKKTKIILAIIAAAFLLFIILQNQQLKSDKTKLEGDIKKIEEKKEDEEKKELTISVFEEAKEVAENFINANYEFTNQPEKEEVMSFVIGDAKDQLSFQDDIETDEEMPEIKAKVNDLQIYYGQKTDDRQEIFGHFKSQIQIGDMKRESPSFVVLDMVKINDEWKVENIDFMQY